LKQISYQSGFTTLGILLSLGFALLAGYAFGFLANYIPPEKPPTAPLFLISILLLPSTLTAQLILKLSEVKKAKGLSREERRRIEQIVSIKTTKLYLLLVFYAFSAILIGAMFYAATLAVPVSVITWTLRVTGFLLLLSAIMAIYSVKETRKIGLFEAKITERSQERKAKVALLKRLKESQKD
jgi:hypothetical protein